MENKEWLGEGAESGQQLNPYLQDLLNTPKPRDTVLLEHLCRALPNQQRQKTEALKPYKRGVSDNKVEARLRRKLFIALSHSMTRLQQDFTSRSLWFLNPEILRRLGVRYRQQRKGTEIITIPGGAGIGEIQLK